MESPTRFTDKSSKASKRRRAKTAVGRRKRKERKTVF